MTVNASIRHGGFAVALFAALACAPIMSAHAEDAAPGSAVVATVNGEAITEADLANAARDFRDQLAQLPPTAWRERLLDLLIEIKLSARAAEDMKLDQDPAVVQRLKDARDRALRLEFLREKVFVPITEEAIRARFDKEIADFKPGTEYEASHILVKDEDEAKAIIAELDKGGDFAAIAKEKSIDPGTKDKGGDLGFFSPEKMVKPFADAVKGTPVGTYTKTPVQSQYGWHVIKIVATRPQEAPTYDERGPAIRDQMVEEFYTAALNALHEKAKIEIVKPAPPAGGAAPADQAPAKQ